MRSERGQASVALVGIVLLFVLAGALFAHLMRVDEAGATGQRAADLAALAAAGQLAREPFAGAAGLRPLAERVAADNGARLTGFRLLESGGVPSGVEVRVSLSATGDVPGGGHRTDSVPAVSRAGVSFAAALPQDGFRPVDLGGGSGRAAIVSAAAAQVGWPYVWGGESRAEGGFDCSGLVDFAYSAAGHPLPGRPTAASLWQIARPLSPAELLPGDLVFAGAATGAPYHVGMYAGGGAVVVAPHTGAQVRFEPLAGGGWDGFGRVVELPGDGSEPASRGIARRVGVPPDVLDAELALGLTADAGSAAVALAAAQARHPGDLEAALTDQLGSASAAALVLRQASGPGLGEGFSAAVRLLPRPSPVAAAAAVSGGPAIPLLAAGEPAPSEGSTWGGRIVAITHLAETVSAQAAERGGGVSLQALAGVHHGARFALTGLSLLLPGRWQDLPAVAGAAWDAAGAAVETVAAWGTAGVELSGFGLWAARFNALGGAFSTGMFGYQMLTARSRRDRIGFGLLAAGSGIATAGTLSAGMGMVPFLAAGAVVVPPVGLGLIAVGAGLCVAGYLYRHPEWCRAALDLGGRVLDTAWRIETAPVRAAGSVVHSVGNAARSVLDEIPTPW